MALRVWLPLNGNLENKGISDYAIQSANITIVNNGKIGKCYSFNGSSSYISITNFNLGNNWSYGCWINTPNSDSRGWEIVMILNNSGSDADSQFAFWVHQKENRFESLANTQYVSTIPYTNYYNSWHHFFATFNGSLLTTYIDGNIVNTKTITTEYYPATNLTIGARSNNAAGTAFTSWFQGYLNDIRVYDNCLSQKEVKEIAQGLVLHYKLDGFSGGVGENLVRGSNSNTILTNKWLGHSAIGGNVSTIEQDETGTYCVKVTRDATEQSSWDYLSYDNFLRDRIKTDTEYTISFDCKPSVNGSIGFTGFVNGNATNYMTNSTTVIQGNCTANQWNHMIYKCRTINSFDAITVSSQVVYFSRSASLKGTNVTILFKNIKVEEGSIATSWSPALEDLGINTAKIVDSSGYENHSYPNGIYFVSEQGPRYNVIADFSEEGHITSPELSTSKGNTIAFWCSASNWSEYSLVGAICQGTNWSITSNNNNLILALLSHVSAENSNYNLAQDYTWTLMPTSSLGVDWHYFVLTYINHEIKFYLDGILYKTINNISTDIADYFYTNYLSLAALPVA